MRGLLLSVADKFLDFVKSFAADDWGMGFGTEVLIESSVIGYLAELIIYICLLIEQAACIYWIREDQPHGFLRPHFSVRAQDAILIQAAGDGLAPDAGEGRRVDLLYHSGFIGVCAKLPVDKPIAVRRQSLLICAGFELLPDAPFDVS